MRHIYFSGNKCFPRFPGALELETANISSVRKILLTSAKPCIGLVTFLLKAFPHKEMQKHICYIRFCYICYMYWTRNFSSQRRSLIAFPHKEMQKHICYICYKCYIEHRLSYKIDFNIRTTASADQMTSSCAPCAHLLISSSTH